jgi:mannose-6-phosphate isomerase-like protein (cupin superfamily)
MPQEVYYVENILKGQGSIRVVIVPGQRHNVWQEGEGDLVMLVTCAPVYSVEEVVFEEWPEQ